MSEPFDFEAFISGTQLARRNVGFYKIDHRGEIDRLTREHDALPADAGDERESSKASPRKALAEKIAALREEMEASRVTMVIRTLGPDEVKSIQPDDKDVYDQLALQSVEPVLNRDQWKRLADKIGNAQFAQLTAEAHELLLSRVAVPDFSRSVSQTLSPPPPSQS